MENTLTRGGRYCCAINCCNNSKTSVDHRTGKPVRFHRFPDPHKEKERCSRWIVNLRRADLNLKNITSKRVCAIHFEPNAYNCPDDISSCRLLPTAVPTVVDCPFPPKTTTPSRPPPKKRQVSPAPSETTTPRPSLKKRRVSLATQNGSADHSLCNATTAIQSSGKETDSGSSGDDIESLKRQLAAAKSALQCYKKTNKLITQKNQRLLIANKKVAAKNQLLYSKLEKERKSNVEKLLDQLPPVPSALINVLLKKAKRISWKDEPEVVNMCLSLFFRSSSAYATIRSSGFVLPHPNTLRSRFSDVFSNGVGLCPSLLEMVKLRTLTLAEHEKRVTLSLDGMAVREGISYQKHSDTLVGFADYGSHEESSTNIPADQGVVLMIRGLTLRWKQVIGYYLTRHNISTCTLKNIIFDAVKQLTSLGLSVEALVMDQESSQWKFIKDVGVSIEKPYFTAVEDKKCHIIPDPPHLIKNLRNNFKTKDIFYVLHGVKGKARWNHLEQLYKLDRSNHIHAVPRLRDDHFLLPRGKKMKVILACQILSHSVASALKFYVCKNLLPPEVKETADFIEMVNSMWDFIDSHSLSAPTGKKPVSVRTYEEDMERFDFFYAFVSSFKFVRTGDGKEIKLPSHCGWLLALKSLKALSTHLLKDEKILTHLCLRKCNQDHVENLHSQIRNYNGFNDHPKAESYINALRCLACSSSTTELLDKTISAGANCLSDKEASPYTISPPDAVTYKSSSAGQTDLEESNSEGPTLEWELGVLELEGKQLGEVEKEIVNYIAGSVVRKLNNNHQLLGICAECISRVTSVDSKSITLTSLKEYKQGCLITVSESVTSLCSSLELIFQSSSKNGLPLPNPKKQITDHFKSTFDFKSVASLNCHENHLQALLNAIVSLYYTIRIFHFVKLFNQSLIKGKRGSELNKDKKLNM